MAELATGAFGKSLPALQRDVSRFDEFAFFANDQCPLVARHTRHFVVFGELFESGDETRVLVFAEGNVLAEDEAFEVVVKEREAIRLRAMETQQFLIEANGF